MMTGGTRCAPRVKPEGMGSALRFHPFGWSVGRNDDRRFRRVNRSA